MSPRTQRSGGKAKAGRRPSRWWLVGVVVVLAGVFWVTLWPVEEPAYPTGTNWKPLDHHGEALQALQREGSNRRAIVYYLASDVLGNVLLFTPLGAVLAGSLAGRRDRSGRASNHAAVRLAGAVGLGVLLSIAIEIVQLQIPGRATDVDDVIFNTVGTLVGASALLVGERVIASRR